ncbi:MAG: YfhO family protein [Candidatus Omnitrophota bacterium]
MIFIAGAYTFFLSVAKYRLSAVIAFVSLSFSSLATAYLKQNSLILSSYLFPWILWSTLKFLTEYRLRFLVYLTFFSGIALSSYHGAYVILSLAVVLACLFLTKGLSVRKVFAFKKGIIYVLGALFYLCLLTLNIFVVYLTYKNDVVPTSRLFEAPLAAPAFFADFLNLFIPYSFALHFFNWHFMSESFLYIGLIPLVFVCIGLIYSHHPYKRGFAFACVVIALIMLNDNTHLFTLCCKILPFFSAIRNTLTFGPFFIFCLIVLECFGLDIFFEKTFLSQINSFIRPIYLIVIGIGYFAILANRQLIRVYPLIITPYNILKDYATITTKALTSFLEPLFYQSDVNSCIFILGSSIIFFAFTKPQIRMSLKVFFLILFIFVDLSLFHQVVLSFVTMPRRQDAVTQPTDFVYRDKRIAFISPEYPFYAFSPAMLKKDAAYSTNIPWVTTHFYEMKNFFYFFNNQRISFSVKSDLMGISAPKLRLVPKAVVLPQPVIVVELEKADSAILEKVVFLEEALPLKYSHLILVSRDDIQNLSTKEGEIEVIRFGPNEILMDVHCLEDCFLFYSDGFDKDWKVFIDEQRQKVYKANLAFKSIVMEKGTHRVQFIYEPGFYIASLIFYFAGLFLILGFWFLKSFKRFL